MGCGSAGNKREGQVGAEVSLGMLLENFLEEQ